MNSKEGGSSAPTMLAFNNRHESFTNGSSAGVTADTTPPPAIDRTASVASQDTLGVVSAASSSQQTRFSFYNAEDFKVGSSPKSTKKSPKLKNQSAGTMRFSNFHTSSDETKLAQVVMDTVEALQQSDEMDHDIASATDSNLDSVEILRSLQEHEQQRLDILAGPKKNFKSSSVSNSTQSFSNRSHVSATNSHRHGSVVSSSAADGTENSNPYEEAIKEALQLIRKHRAPRISDPQLSAEAPEQNQYIPESSSLSNARGSDLNNSSVLHPIAAKDYLKNDSKELEQEFLQLMIRTRSPPGTIVGSTSHGQEGDLLHQPTPLSDAGLGEAYQAEIEARRKQRQERMARYASRLAELKQDDDDDGIPVVDTARSLDSSVDYGSSGIARGTGRQHHNWNGGDPVLAMSRSWEDDTGAAARSQEEFGSYMAPIASNAGSVSTLSNTVRQDDEVQRGVERVLLAILERASSRGRSNVEGSLFAPRNLAISEPLTAAPVTGFEEKNFNNGKPSDDVLLQAMTNLLRPSALALSPPVPDVLEENDPSSSLHTQEDPNVTNYYQGSYKTEISHSSLNGFVSNQRPLSRVSDAGLSSPEEPIAPIETVSNPNIVDTDKHDDHAKNKHKHLEEISISDYNDDDLIDDKLQDDEGESEDETESYGDEGSSVSEDDESDHGIGKYKGVLGPLSKRSGGTTGVVLEDYSLASSATYDDEPAEPSQAASILESLSAAVSRVTGISKVEDSNHVERSSRGDKYSRHSVDGSDDVSSESTDSHANELMRSLCAHLLPAGVDPSRRILDEVPEWDESNPDEAGYRIVRLTSFQLRGIQKEYDRMVQSLKRKSLILSPKTGIDDTAFEIDLRAAEKLLDEVESKVKLASVGAPISQTNSSTVFERFTPTKVDEGEGLVAFPGVRPAGKGEMGDLEYFSLPIIFKSHVTGFEPTKDMILEPGNVVAGQYLVEGVLGSAAFSTAYKCVDLNSEVDKDGCQDLVCLKVIKNTKDFFDQSLDEIKILELLRQTRKCNEKFIVEMKTFFYHREHLVIVTELLRQNLFEFGKFILDSGEEPYFTLPRLSYIARQCLIALDFVHGMGLVHSDVKPENILLASYSRAQAKLIDFGSSCYLTDRQSSYIQSRSYRAPEVVLGLPYDGRIDIWSLGCVVAEMFTGEVTFQNDSVVSMLSRIEAICGPFPRHMIAQGRQSARFFTKCGLLFEKVVHENSDNTDASNSYSEDSSYEVDADGNHRQVHIDIFQPKRTTLAARLGFAPNLMDKFGSQVPLSSEEQRQASFCDFVHKLLTIDPETRLTAAEALSHPAMLYAATLTEADVKYPST
jgi:dual specificity tyrosine-phosphorylation-regulated kinase 2/3/4